MRRKFLNQSIFASAVIGASIFVASCDKKEDTPVVVPQGEEDKVEEVFHIAYGVGTGGVGSTSNCVIKPFTQLNSGEISFNGDGFEVSESRTDRVYASADGKELYSLQYQAGTILKMSYVGLQNPFYAKIEGNAGKRDLQGILGSTSIRWKKISESEALAYDVEVKHHKNNDGSYKNTTSTIHFAKIDLKTFTPQKVSVDLPAETDTSVPNLHTWRVDGAVVLNDKLYIGMAKRGYNGADNINGNAYKTSTLVLDYPSLANPRFIYSDLAKGENYGYRTSPFLTYNGSVYHNSTANTKILKITNGVYDNSYDFDLAQALGMNKVGASGMFDAGNGIAYVVFYDAEKGTSWNSNNKYWGIARIDLSAKTAVKMDLPENLWLAPYQSAKLGKDGKLYMALAPLNTDGNIYIFDPKNTSPTGYTKGATLKISGDAFYIGVF